MFLIHDRATVAAGAALTLKSPPAKLHYNTRHANVVDLTPNLISAQEEVQEGEEGGWAGIRGVRIGKLLCGQGGARGQARREL